MNKIMFNDKCLLTKAVIELLKEMTRREPIFEELKNPRTEFDAKGHLCLYDGDVLVHRSHYARNEEVAVAQSYKDAGLSPTDCVGSIDYGGNMYNPLLACDTSGWKNKMFVSADYMPYTIRITDIKGERLQDISDEDCLKEGVYHAQIPFGFYVRGIELKTPYYESDTGFEWKYKSFKTPRKAFAALIDKVSGKGTWERNPWVFAYSFELIK